MQSSNPGVSVGAIYAYIFPMHGSELNHTRTRLFCTSCTLCWIALTRSRASFSFSSTNGDLICISLQQRWKRRASSRSWRFRASWAQPPRCAPTGRRIARGGGRLSRCVAGTSDRCVFWGVRLYPLHQNRKRRLIDERRREWHHLCAASSMRACPRLDPHLTRLTQAAVPPTVWQVVDRNRRADLAPSLAKHPESTAEADEAKTGSRDALAGRERLPWVSSSPRTRGLKMPTSGLWCGRVACLYEKVRPGPSCTGPPRPPS